MTKGHGGWCPSCVFGFLFAASLRGAGQDDDDDAEWLTYS